MSKNVFFKFNTSLVLCFFTAIFSSLSVANESTSALLEDAEKLVEIAPERSMKVAQQYLASRTLTAQGDASIQSHASRDETDATLRTPNSSIKALQVIAKAKYLLADYRGALTNIDQAIALASTYHLPHQKINTQLLKVEFLWRLTHDKSKIETTISKIEKQLSEKENTILATQLKYRLLMFKAEIAAYEKNDAQVQDYFEQAFNYLNMYEQTEIFINYQLTLGKYYLTTKNYNQALYQLLSGYWSAIEKDKPALLAKINRVMADLFIDKSVLDKALEHLSQAADFYDNYENSSILDSILKKMADIYYAQGKYNLALVYYFNILDSENINRDIKSVIKLRLDLSKTYLQLYNYALAEQYLQRANTLLNYTHINQLQAESYLLSSELELFKSNFEKSIILANDALLIGQKINAPDIQLQAYLLLTKSNENIENYTAAYKYGKQYNKLITNKQKKLLTISENDFKEQKLFIEQSLHYKNQTKLLALSNEEQIRAKYATIVFFVLTLVIFALFVRRGMVNNKMRNQLTTLYNEHYTHPRSGLRNFRLLNVKLPSSLEQSSANFEQWKSGDLIKEPLHDKLRFIMVDLSFVRTTYLQKGYNAGLQLEAEFGSFIKDKLQSSVRLYHFSDGMFLYVEPNTNPNKTTSELFEQINQWVIEFKPQMKLDRTIRAGIADYPFLPKAYTAINDKELIDILLMASNLARLQHQQHGGNQWVSLRAIDNAPAASFASGNIRSSCLIAIEKGLIKIDSSTKIEDNIIKLSLID
ncbi:tetratricopeptide repeat protein [Vibrio sp. TH_r3]|uniref:tetratricopeptide repeat protein n=1 Tax=Vibrio sp. TH_r3 TaxID=3082084 RepID=UPI002955BA48|nr:tetratricopeptide repeat protein [Vibrio sp. TH_r3]MDV7105019.1 tetratricopeptide repeat protein [Vibrio sp. TH_r3]